MAKSCEILMFVCNQVAKSREILMFVCVQKDAKQCCYVTKIDCSHCSWQLSEQGTTEFVTSQHCLSYFEDKQTSKFHKT